MEILSRCIGDPHVKPAPGRLVEVTFTTLQITLRMSAAEALQFAAQLHDAARRAA